MTDLIKNIYTLGLYYNPATDHYPNADYVFCDRCKKTRIYKCIGWENYDLCITCVCILYDTETFDKVPEEVKKIMNTIELIPEHKSNSSLNNVRSKMMQMQFNKSKRNKPKRIDGIYIETSKRGLQCGLGDRMKVSCDRCKKSRLIECVGWKGCNLCLECVGMLNPKRPF